MKIQSSVFFWPMGLSVLVACSGGDELGGDGRALIEQFDAQGSGATAGTGATAAMDMPEGTGVDGGVGAPPPGATDGGVGAPPSGTTGGQTGATGGSTSTGGSTGGEADCYSICGVNSTEPSADGWAWDNDIMASCAVSGTQAAMDIADSLCGGGSGGDAATGGGSGDPDCFTICGGNSTAPDADGWAWDNDIMVSCAVSGTQAAMDIADNLCGGGSGGSGSGGGASTGGSVEPACYPLCASASSDPDEDGWGWEGDSSCVVSGSPLEAEQTICGG